MRLGAVFPQAEFTRVDAEEILALVHALEDAGYDHLLVFDHVLGADSRTRPGWDGAYDHTHAFLEPLVLCGFLLRECSLELVTDVLVLPQRQTALVAKQAATLELLAPGRLRLGWASVGTPWSTRRWARTSPPGPPGRRSRSRSCAGSGPRRPSTTRAPPIG